MINYLLQNFNMGLFGIVLLLIKLTKKQFLIRILITLFLSNNFTNAFSQHINSGQVDTSFVTPKKAKIEFGKFIKIYDQSVNESKQWYINDHCFIKDDADKWHMFGITHEEPANPLNEINLAHATADSLMQKPWSKQPFALTVNTEEPWREIHLWAPFVIRHNEQYYMYYCAGGETNSSYKIHLAISKDLKNWNRHPLNPMVIDGYDARDPHIIRVKDKWIMYYTATRPASKGNHVVIAIESKDLINWSNKQVVFKAPKIGTYGGPTESPFVLFRKNKYYLFVCTNTPYDNTAVYESTTPYHWEYQNKVAEFPAHCAEIIEVENHWYISRAGWGRKGLYISKLKWND